MSEASIKKAPPKARPKFLDLTQIRLPLPGWISILHRVSGVGLFLFLPVLIKMLAMSLSSPGSYAHLQSLIGHPLLKLILLGLLWSYLHHFCAGIRFLLLDVHKGLDLPVARKSAGAVLIVSLTLTVVLGAKLW